MPRLRWCLYAALLAALPVAAAGQDPPARASHASLMYGRTQFTRGTDPWNTLTAELSTRTGPGPVAGRVTLADRFGRTGAQVEADVYPALARGVYGYLNLGYSRASIFPEWRMGAELWANPPGGWEVSAGLRRLLFASTDVTILTGSVGRYLGNYWISARPWVRPARGETSASLHGQVRRYFSDARHYVGVSAGGGSALSEDVVAEELERLSSARVAVDGKTPLRGTALRLQWGVALEHEQLPGTRTRDRVSTGIGLEHAF